MKRLVALTTCIASAAAPASAAEKFPVPEDTGLYLGAGVYEESGRMLCGGFCFTYWEPGTLDPTGCVRLAAEEGFCNTLQFWLGARRLREIGPLARENGLYVTCMGGRGTNGLARAIVEELGPAWIGFDFGERFGFQVNDLGERGGTLPSVADDYLRSVREYVDELHVEGWGNVMATSANFSLDYEVASSPPRSRAASTASTTCRCGARTWRTSGTAGSRTGTPTRCGRSRRRSASST